MDPTPPPEQALFLAGPVGRLEARLRRAPDTEPPSVAALLCHPHPLFGGTMANKTLYRIAKRLATEVGVPALRFNFRGAGASEGVHDGGRGELEDVLAALQALAERYPAAGLVVIGYSFGAVVGLRAGVADERVTRLVALGLPLDGQWSVDFLRRTRKPCLVVQGENDEFGGEVQVRSFLERLSPQPELHVVPGADHLFHGREDEAVAAVVDYIRRSMR